jgi:hypothetical protein
MLLHLFTMDSPAIFVDVIFKVILKCNGLFFYNHKCFHQLGLAVLTVIVNQKGS